MEITGSDLRYAARTLVRRPALTLTAVASLALGIGANSAILSLVDALGLRPQPIDRPDRLVRAFTTTPSSSTGSFSYPEYRDIAAHVPAVSSLAAYGIRGVALTGLQRRSDVTMMAAVSGNYFPTLAVPAAAGRLLHETDDAAGAPPTAVISWRLWQERYGGGAAAVGGTIELNRRPFVIAGTLPRDFSGLDPLLVPDVWISFAGWDALGGARGELTDRSNRWVRVIGRLREDATVRSADAQIATLMSGPAGSGRAVADAEQRLRLSRIAGAVFGAIGAFVLLLGCVNVAALLLAQAEERRHEIAVRAAIGGTRLRLMRQLLLESTLLAAMAAGGGIVLAWWLIQLVPLAIPPMPIPIELALRLDGRVVAFATACAAATVCLFGLAPALAGSRADIGILLKASTAGSRSGRARVRQAVVAAQIAVSLALITAAIVLVRSVLSLNAVDAGFDRRPMLMVTMAPGVVGYRNDQTRAFYQALVNRVRALPGVERVAIAKRAPLSLTGGGAAETVNLPGYEPPPHDPGFAIHYNVVDAAYFETMGTPIVRGRTFSATDADGAPCAAIASEAFARKFWGMDASVGQHLAVGRQARTTCTIVGIAKDAKSIALDESPVPYLYFAFAQRSLGEATLLVRTSGDDTPLVPALRREIDAVDRAVPTLRIGTMKEQLHAATVVQRVTAALVSALAGIGSVLALVGLYGLMSYLVRRGSREIGVRMALGASRAAIVAHTLRQAARPVGAGVAIGVVLAFAVTSLVATSVYGASGGATLTCAIACVVIATAAFAASVIPAAAAARVDPADVLRRE